MYEFNELGKRAQLIAIGNYIKDWKKTHEYEDITVNEVREILEDSGGVYLKNGELYE